MIPECASRLNKHLELIGEEVSRIARMTMPDNSDVNVDGAEFLEVLESTGGKFAARTYYAEKVLHAMLVLPESIVFTFTHNPETVLSDLANQILW